jgi:hypothetical protein
MLVKFAAFGFLTRARARCLCSKTDSPSERSQTPGPSPGLSKPIRVITVLKRILFLSLKNSYRQFSTKSTRWWWWWGEMGVGGEVKGRGVNNIKIKNSCLQWTSDIRTSDIRTLAYRDTPKHVPAKVVLCYPRLLIGPSLIRTPKCLSQRCR